MITLIWLATLTILTIGAVVALYLLWRGNARLLHAVQQRMQTQSEQLPALRVRIERLELEMRAVLERTRQVDPPPIAAPLGTELAPRLAAAGAGAEELMRACGMTQEEAELVVRLHGRGES
jgi:hypothetical protein